MDTYQSYPTWFQGDLSVEVIPLLSDLRDLTSINLVFCRSAERSEAQLASSPCLPWDALVCEAQ